MAPSIVPCANAGVEIHGVQLSRLSRDEVQLIKRQLAFHGVVFFRDQEITPKEHLEFARHFGPIDVNRYFAHVPDHPEVAQLLKEPESKRIIGETLHTDTSYDVSPALGSILVARELPSKGGDTLFLDMRKAFAALPVDLQRRLEGMNAVHTGKHVFVLGEVQVAVHPVVIRHPESGQKALFVNPSFTTHFEGQSVAESKPLLDYLFRHAAQPQFVERFKWRPGSVAFWDNRMTWHSALNDYHGERRLMHRVTIEGCKLSDLNDRVKSPEELLADDQPTKYDPSSRFHQNLQQKALGLIGDEVFDKLPSKL